MRADRAEVIEPGARPGEPTSGSASPLIIEDPGPAVRVTVRGQAGSAAGSAVEQLSRMNARGCWSARPAGLSPRRCGWASTACRSRVRVEADVRARRASAASAPGWRLPVIRTCSCATLSRCVTLEQLQRGHLADLAAMTAEQRGHYTKIFGDPLDWVRRRLGHCSIAINAELPACPAGTGDADPHGRWSRTTGTPFQPPPGKQGERPRAGTRAPDPAEPSLCRPGCGYPAPAPSGTGRGGSEVAFTGDDGRRRVFGFAGLPAAGWRVRWRPRSRRAPAQAAGCGPWRRRRAPGRHGRRFLRFAASQQPVPANPVHLTGGPPRRLPRPGGHRDSRRGGAGELRRLLLLLDQQPLKAHAGTGGDRLPRTEMARPPGHDGGPGYSDGELARIVTAARSDAVAISARIEAGERLADALPGGDRPP